MAASAAQENLLEKTLAIYIFFCVMANFAISGGLLLHLPFKHAKYYLSLPPNDWRRIAIEEYVREKEDSIGYYKKKIKLQHRFFWYKWGGSNFVNVIHARLRIWKLF